MINVCSFYFWRRTQSLPHEEEGGSMEDLKSIEGESETLVGAQL